MLLCAPSLGVLDNWLPVLQAARQARRTGPAWRIVALLPEAATIAQLDPEDTAHLIADELIDVTVAPLADGAWVAAPGFLAVGPLTTSRPWTVRLPGVLRRLARTQTQRSATVPLSVLDDPANRLLYDVQLHDKPRLAPLLAALGRVPRWSHHHGIELEEVGQRRVRPPDLDRVQGVLLYGPSEVDAFAANYGLERARLHPVGVIRHEPGWVRAVIERSAERHELPFAEYVFVVSRPAGSPYLPRERKVAALRALHRVSWEEHGIPLVLRTHPKENEDGTLSEALPADGEGVSWERSKAHPFHLATRSRMAVTFFSGVVVDMVALGVPVIELLDVRGLDSFDGDDSPRDGRGRPRFGPYRRDGLVIPADDVDDLRAAFEWIVEDRDGALATLQSAMRERFTDPALDAGRLLRLLTTQERRTDY